MAQHPNAVSLAEASRVLHAYGWELVRVRGSHHLFRCGSGELTIPFKRPHLLAVYVRQILAVTQEEEEVEEDNGDEDS